MDGGAWWVAVQGVAKSRHNWSDLAAAAAAASNLAIPLDIYPVITQEKWKQMSIRRFVHNHSSIFICNSQKLQTIQLSTNMNIHDISI